jgi:multiple antibiotic resistance protein
VALWAGAAVIGFFGVTLAALRIAGGLVVAVRAWELLSAPQHQEGRKQAQAAPAAGAEDVTFFPLTVPFTTGPGTIAVAIALGANRPTGAPTSSRASGARAGAPGSSTAWPTTCAAPSPR